MRRAATSRVTSTWSRAFGPGSRRALAALLIAGSLAVTACGSAGSKYPAFLPKATLHPNVDALLVGTETRPALQVEGLPVEVVTPSFRVRMVVAGPVVPGEGLPNQQQATTATWTVTMSGATADVPVSIADFHSIDHLGSIFVMGLVPGEQPPPPVLLPDHTLTFRVRAYELVGEGMMQYSPDRKHLVAMWDYTVEND